MCGLQQNRPCRSEFSATAGGGRAVFYRKAGGRLGGRPAGDGGGPGERCDTSPDERKQMRRCLAPYITPNPIGPRPCPKSRGHSPSTRGAGGFFARPSRRPRDVLGRLRAVVERPGTMLCRRGEPKWLRKFFQLFRLALESLAMSFSVQEAVEEISGAKLRRLAVDTGSLRLVYVTLSATAFRSHVNPTYISTYARTTLKVKWC